MNVGNAGIKINCVIAVDVGFYSLFFGIVLAECNLCFVVAVSDLAIDLYHADHLGHVPCFQ